jgi:site-specific recombinase|tara:strand:- start:431 stop:658 length:228 start_codon:yes stop_codon:yes gene_type:complete
MPKAKKKVVSSYSSTNAHQRIDDHEKLCRIMQHETNRKIKEIKIQMNRLEKIVLYAIGMIILGMGTIIMELFGRI